MTLAISPSRPQLDQDAAAVSRFFEAWAAGDVSHLDALATEDVVVAPLLGLLFEREAYRGRSGLAAAFRETTARWHSLELTVEDVVADADRLDAGVRIVMGRNGPGTAPRAYRRARCLVPVGPVPQPPVGPRRGEGRRVAGHRRTRDPAGGHLQGLVRPALRLLDRGTPVGIGRQQRRHGVAL